MNNRNVYNICKFIPSPEGFPEIAALNFVYETNCPHEINIMTSSYRLHLVTGGEGCYLHDGASETLKRGDIFLSFKAKEYTLLNNDNFQYVYISFVGKRVKPLLERLNISETQCVFHGQKDDLIDLWEKSLRQTNRSNIDLISQAMLYFTFAKFAEQTKEKKYEQSDSPIEFLKKHVDSNFNDPDLTLASVSEKFGYSPKYVSNLFKKTLSITFSDYVKMLRMDYARSLICDGERYVLELSAMCGYKDALYFSKIFKSYFGESPKAYINRENRKK